MTFIDIFYFDLDPGLKVKFQGQNAFQFDICSYNLFNPQTSYLVQRYKKKKKKKKKIKKKKKKKSNKKKGPPKGRETPLTLIILILSPYIH